MGAALGPEHARALDRALHADTTTDAVAREPTARRHAPAHTAAARHHLDDTRPHPSSLTSNQSPVITATASPSSQADAVQAEEEDKTRGSVHHGPARDPARLAKGRGGVRGSETGTTPPLNSHRHPPRSTSTTGTGVVTIAVVAAIAEIGHAHTRGTGIGSAATRANTTAAVTHAMGVTGAERKALAL